jgi:hypothetical protein
MGKISHLWSGIRKCRNQCGFANVGRPYEYYLASTFPIDPMSHIPSAGWFLRLLLGLELGETALEISSKFVRALVLGNDSQKLFQGLEFFSR